MFHALRIPSVPWGMSNTWTLDHYWVSSLHLSWHASQSICIYITPRLRPCQQPKLPSSTLPLVLNIIIVHINNGSHRVHVVTFKYFYTSMLHFKSTQGTKVSVFPSLDICALYRHRWTIPALDARNPQPLPASYVTPHNTSYSVQYNTVQLTLK